MSRLLENILKNRNQQILSELDMTKSGTAMLRHLGQGFPYDEEDNVPIEPKPTDWQQLNDDRGIFMLQKTYELDSIKFLLYFVNEIIYLSEDMNHHPEIIINHTQVTLKLYTRDINDVTDRDIELSKKIDEIIDDIKVIKFRGNQ